ncbi:multidrug DMT transporter permease [Agromyces atrinae]|uniref:Drug/metabolite transporter (DMT)-like permease n=1 Tax=Agromyces atrinae TaxID=592376 RepID=A0A4Q2M7Z0_9MICO|nr:multidrug DMT transporter permease [Agromyces atrinae]NYD67673.1 drug/metabolite transporter (DMT)-like permease [Agromyces atrinae]RXZ88128.1 multidrug DMT transporter permease [Agromyces atrinae]
MTVEPSSAPLIGIALAVTSAAALAVGNLLQARGVRSMEAGVASGASGSKAVNLVRNRFWLIGGVMLGVAIVLQMGSLAFAPLMVVQPIGVVALVFTVLLTALFAHQMPSRAVLISIATCVVGVAGFVTVAALVSTQHAITDVQLIAILVVLGFVLVTTAAVWYLGRHRRTPPVMWVLLGGIYSAFVATLGKTVILRVQTALHSGGLTWNVENTLTLVCIAGIGIAGGLSVYFVQRAHAANRPDVVVAGLTVVDPAVAVTLGIVILGEASSAAPWAFVVFAVAGAIAIVGVFALSRAESRAE